MAIQTLYCFLQDDALRTTNKLDLDSSFDQGYGVLSGEAKNYFIQPGVITDPRINRLQLIENSYGKGTLSLTFDQKYFDTRLISGMSDVEYTLFFNIVERLYLQNQLSLQTIRSDHLTSYLYTGSNNGYVTGSATVGDTIKEGITFIDSQKRTHTIALREWFSFEFYYGTVSFKVYVWMSRSAFFKDYPYTTITNVIPPYSPDILKTPGSLLLTGNLSVLTASSNYIFSDTNLEMVARDQSGVFIYTTKYVVDNNRSISLPFALPYCGSKQPSTLESRAAIRSYLEEATSLTDTQLEALFPELYVSSRFFVVPLWDMYYQATDREIYNSILSWKKISTRVDTLFADYEESYRKEHLELILQAYNNMPLVAIPDVLNNTYTSILEQHPTYQDYSTQVPGWRYMSSATQEFASKLIKCIAILNGETISGDYIELTIGSKNYLSFTSGKSEYLVMKKASYNEYIF